MSRANVETVRRWHAAMSAGLDETLAAIEELCDPDVDFYPGELYSCHWLRRASLLRIENHLTADGALRSLDREGESLPALRSAAA